MTIYLVQHGKCLSKIQDPEKGLSEEGFDNVRRIAQVASSYGISVNEILHSGKKRARQTAEIMAEALDPPKGVRAIDGINPLDDVRLFAETVVFASQCMIVGHLPFLEKLAAYFVTGQYQDPIFQLQNGGILCLGHYEGSQQVVIKWALMPNIK